MLVVHTAFSKVGPVEGGPRGLIDALRAVLGPDGTLVMPSMGDDDDHVVRSGDVAGASAWASSPTRSGACPASGAATARMRSPPPARAPRRSGAPPGRRPHGPDSPVGRACALDGQVLLVGVGHDANTTIHLGEMLAGVRYRRPAHATILRDGQPVRVDYGENDCCCERFALVDGCVKAAASSSAAARQRGGAARPGARHRRVVTAHLAQDESSSFIRPASTPNATRRAPRCRRNRRQPASGATSGRLIDPGCGNVNGTTGAAHLGAGRGASGRARIRGGQRARRRAKLRPVLARRRVRGDGQSAPHAEVVS